MYIEAKVSTLTALLSKTLYYNGLYINKSKLTIWSQLVSMQISLESARQLVRIRPPPHHHPIENPWKPYPYLFTSLDPGRRHKTRWDPPEVVSFRASKSAGVQDLSRRSRPSPPCTLVIGLPTLRSLAPDNRLITRLVWLSKFEISLRRKWIL